MKVFTRNDLRTQLRRKEISPVYVLFGEETYLRNLASETIANIALKDASMRDFNEIEISLNDVSVSEALIAAEQRPMLDSRRLIRVTDVCVSGNRNKDNLSENDGDILKSYLSNPSDTSVVVFLVDELDKRRKMSKLLLKHSYAVEFKALQDAELIQWAKDKFQELKVRVDNGVLHHLVALVGNNVRKLNLEIEKLSVAAMPDGIVSVELVEMLVPSSRVLSNFKLTDYLLSNEGNKALQVMKKILDDGAEPLMLLGLLSYNFHRLLMAKELMEEGADRREVSKVMRLPYNNQQSFLETARRTKREKFAWILKRLSEADLAIKTSIASPRLQIEMLVCELTGI